ncbi:kinetochore-associated protein DSN1 homolog isoform X1 [Agelaius phoeniceus]|uniref:kinetochore-associated protein DSN1 homolog isoform X1 n=1 Tax=Agelaius phoeniceus TaxID=39638 RepID=UPI004054AEF1
MEKSLHQTSHWTLLAGRTFHWCHSKGFQIGKFHSVTFSDGKSAKIKLKPQIYHKTAKPRDFPMGIRGGLCRSGAALRVRPFQGCPGGASPESGGVAPGAASEVILKPPSGKGAPSSPFSPGQEPHSLRLSPVPAASSPQRRRRSWRRSSLQGRRCRRRSLPPVHREVTDLSQSISLELPEVQRLSLLLLSSFQFCARQLQQDLRGSPGFDPELFSAQALKGSEQLQRLLQRLLQDGTLRNCLEPAPGDCLDPALEGPVGQVKLLMASLSGELQAWDRLLQQHRERSQETSGWMRHNKPGKWCWNSTSRAGASSAASRSSWLPERSGGCRDPQRGSCCRRGPRRRCPRRGNENKKGKSQNFSVLPQNVPGFWALHRRFRVWGRAVVIGCWGCQSEGSANHRAEGVRP